MITRDSHRRSARLITLLAATLLLVLLQPVASAQAAATTARDLLASLPTATEVRTGYDRNLFNHWIDANGNGCNTRAEVLIAESQTAVTRTGTCTITAGRWYSPYDQATWTAPSDVDIDHMVPLAEAWDSGARSWTASRRTAFANDLGLAESLIAVTDSVNQSKGDQDPAQWMPSNGAYACTYVTAWIMVKYRWNLSVDQAERTALTSRLNSGGCGDRTIDSPPRA
ncbi:HNH endonuclease family protein [Aeromicrobium alkaliterrae]|uniref:HNH endonuclease family protein n=1 Tax=Aeromicrobium alkaliterrae TaxID=302168 RepID=A0ABN2K763_9ACTN